MAKVKKGFFCVQEKKAYSPGDEYTGKRKDVGHLLEVKEQKTQKSTKEQKTPRKTKAQK